MSFEQKTARTLGKNPAPSGALVRKKGRSWIPI